MDTQRNPNEPGGKLAVRDNKADNNQTAKNRNVNAVSGKSKAISTARASRVAVTKPDNKPGSLRTKRAVGVIFRRRLRPDKECGK